MKSASRQLEALQRLDRHGARVPMPGCVLHVEGESFAVDEFLAGSSLKPYQVFRKGENDPHRKNERWATSGFKIGVSDVNGELSGECADAVEFLRANSDELERLAAFAGVESMTLDFGYERRAVVIQCDSLPPELLHRAGSLGIGIELTLYPPASEEGGD